MPPLVRAAIDVFATAVSLVRMRRTSAAERKHAVAEEVRRKIEAAKTVRGSR